MRMLCLLGLVLLAGCGDKSDDPAAAGDSGAAAAGGSGDDGGAGTGDEQGGTDGDDGDDGGEDGGDDGAELPDAWTDHYYAESTISAGGFVFDETYWVRRSSDPAASTITEEFVATADGTLTVTDIVVDAAAGTFTLTINGDELSGTGTLEGDAWAWTAWSSVSTDSDGHTVESTDVVTETGISSEKTGRTPDGTEEWTLSETLTTTDEATHTEGVAAAGG